MGPQGVFFPLADTTPAPGACGFRDADMLPTPSPFALSSFTSVTAPSSFTHAAVDRRHYTFKDAYVGAGVLFFCVSPHKKAGLRAGPAASRCFVFAVCGHEGPDSTEDEGPDSTLLYSTDSTDSTLPDSTESLSPPHTRSVALLPTPRCPSAAFLSSTKPRK